MIAGADVRVDAEARGFDPLDLLQALGILAPDPALSVELAFAAGTMTRRPLPGAVSAVRRVRIMRPMS